MKTYKNISEYISNYPAPIQASLKKIRSIALKVAPNAEEKIAYGMPTYFRKGNLFHFAAFEKHIGFYPGPDAINAFKPESTKYSPSKGTMQFPFGKPIPFGLITKIMKFRVNENLKKNPDNGLPKISAPAARAFENAKIKTLKDLSKWTEKDLLSLHGVGPHSIPILKKAMKAKGLIFKK